MPKFLNSVRSLIDMAARDSERAALTAAAVPDLSRLLAGDGNNRALTASRCQNH